MLSTTQLHASLESPVLDAMNFLNEIMSRHPNAISFAPGAPNPQHFDTLDIPRYLKHYEQYLCLQKKHSRQKAQHTLYQYGPAGGIINELLAEVIQKDKNISTSPESLVITVGAQEGMLLTLRALFRDNTQQLAVVTPCFVGILGAARLLDISVVGVNETAEGIDFEAFEQQCIQAQKSQRPIRALYVAPDYSNPGGYLWSLETRQKLLELAQRQDLLLIEDNAYGFTAPKEDILPTLKALDRSQQVIYLGTFAKICFPGARVGYVIADQLVEHQNKTHLLAEDLVKIKSMNTVNTSSICQAIIGGMIIEYGGSFHYLEQQHAKFYQQKLTALLNALEQYFPLKENQAKGVTWNKPRGGFFVRMQLPVPTDLALLERSASEYGVIWTPMASFYLNEEGLHELRLSCSYLDLAQIEEGIRRLASFVNQVTAM